MNPGDKVVHPQWGRGVVLFDKPLCIGIRFVEWGHVNFTPEEWASQKSPARRFRGGISDLEYRLQNAIETGELSEAQALDMLSRNVHPLEVGRKRRLDLDGSFDFFRAHPNSGEAEDEFYHALLRYISSVVKQHSPNRATFSNIEDAIQESALEVWNRLEQYRPERGSIRNWVRLITLHNIRDQIRRFRTAHGNPVLPAKGEVFAPNSHVLLNEDEVITNALPADKQLLLKEYLEQLPEQDRAILQMSIDGLTTREIGAVLGKDYSTISRRLKRLRAATKPPFHA